MGSVTNLGGPRARKLIKVKFTSGAQSDTWYVWAPETPGSTTYAWHEQANAGWEFAGHASGTIFVPAGWTTADLALTVAYEAAGTFAPFMVDGTNDYINTDTGASTVIIQAAASEAYEIPPHWFGAGPFCKLHSLTANQAGDQAQTDMELVMWLVA